MREIRRFRPDAVLTHDPEVLFYVGAGVNHADHRAAGIAAVDAVFPAARNPMAFPSLARAGLVAHVVRRLYLFWPNAPTAWVDVTGTLDRKIAALRCHASQVADPDGLEARIRAWSGRGGRADRRGGRRGVPGHRDRRRSERRAARGRRGLRLRRARQRARTGGQAGLRRRGRTRPQAFQRSLSSSARRPSRSIISPSVSSPAAWATKRPTSTSTPA